MALRLLMCVSHGEAAALRGFHALRDACRAAVHRDATLGAALLFSGHCTRLLIEGDVAPVQALQATLQRLASSLPVQAWPLAAAPAEPRVLPPGSCRSGYVDEEAEAQGAGPAPQACSRSGDVLEPAVRARLEAFLSMLAASDHD